MTHVHFMSAPCGKVCLRSIYLRLEGWGCLFVRSGVVVKHRLWTFILHISFALLWHALSDIQVFLASSSNRNNGHHILLSDSQLFKLRRWDDACYIIIWVPRKKIIVNINICTNLSWDTASLLASRWSQLEWTWSADMLKVDLKMQKYAGSCHSNGHVLSQRRWSKVENRHPERSSHCQSLS